MAASSPLRTALLTPLLLIVLLAFSNRPGLAQNRQAAQPDSTLAQATAMGSLESGAPVPLALALPLRNQDSLKVFLRRVCDPNDTLYGHYLSPSDFARAYGPSEQDYDALQASAKRLGFVVTGTHGNRMVLDVSAPAATVESTFRVHLTRYADRAGHRFYAPDASPLIPAELNDKISGVAGLDSRPMLPMAQPSQDVYPAGLGANEIGTGPLNGLTPSDIKNAYNLNGITVNGAGQTLGLVEFDGYTASDVQAYEAYFGLLSAPITNVMIDGYSGQAGSNADEVTLDIELMDALAPGASGILVYEAPNSSNSAVDVLNRIAQDDQAKSISDSWGQWEQSLPAGLANAENQILQEMAAQGQSFYVASGDDGALMSDPATQPYAVAVGGTSLKTLGGGGQWLSEDVWNSDGHSTGGGISMLWSIPPWQVGVGSPAGLTSTTNRNVPDVALDADPNTGYSIYYQGVWTIYGGTSCAAPLWAAFTALVDEERLAKKKALLGFPNPAIYAIGRGTSYSADFHDIADNMNNDWYQAVAGYDNTTGWGSMNGLKLFNVLVGDATTSFPPTTITDPPLADAYVRGGAYAKDNFGTKLSLLVSEGAVPADDRIAYLKFDLSSVPTDITSATLRLYGSNSATTYSGTASVYAVPSSNWTETGLTDANVPPMGTFLGSAVVTHKAVYLAWNVTQYIQAQKLAQQSQVTLAVVMDQPATTIDTFNSRENKTNQPQLVITSGNMPNAPFGLIAFPRNNQMTLYWVMPVNAVSFSLYRASNANGPFTLLSSNASEPYTDYSAANGTTYWYYVTATNSSGTSAPSSTVFDTPSIDVAELGSWIGNFVQDGSLLYAPAGLGGDFGYGGIVTFDLSGNEAIPDSWTYGDYSIYGNNPNGPLAVGTGVLYGTSDVNGPLGNGTVVSFNSQYNISVLHSFEQFTSGTVNTTGAYPKCNLLVGADGTLYGTTDLGGAYGYGVAFSISPTGTYTKLHDFNFYVDGGYPTPGLTMGPDGKLYGVARGGPYGNGTIFSLTTGGTFRLVHSFAYSEGSTPYTALVLGPGGYLYGTCTQGSTNNSGTVFRTDTLGNVTVLHTFGTYDLHFAGPDGVEPQGDIVVANDGTVYGSTYYGGVNGTGVIYKIDPLGNETLLHTFGPSLQWGSAIPWANSDGANNPGGVIMASDGNLYGLMYSGGKYSEGTAFQCTPSGAFTTMHSFHGY